MVQKRQSSPFQTSAAGTLCLPHALHCAIAAAWLPDVASHCLPHWEHIIGEAVVTLRECFMPRHMVHVNNRICACQIDP